MKATVRKALEHPLSCHRASAFRELHSGMVSKQRCSLHIWTSALKELQCDEPIANPETCNILMERALLSACCSCVKQAVPCRQLSPALAFSLPSFLSVLQG